mgnify:CR=1 FL=1
MAKEKMEQIIDKILEMHSLGCEIDEEIQTVGVGGHLKPQWHIYHVCDFFKVADALNAGHYEKKERNGDEYAFEFCFEHRGVRVFCIAKREEVEALDSCAANRG